jgi:hypothetical protein
LVLLNNWQGLQRRRQELQLVHRSRQVHLLLVVGQMQQERMMEDEEIAATERQMAHLVEVVEDRHSLVVALEELDPVQVSPDFVQGSADLTIGHLAVQMEALEVLDQARRGPVPGLHQDPADSDSWSSEHWP